MHTHSLMGTAVTLILLAISPALAADTDKGDDEERGVTSFTQKYQQMERSDDPQEYMIIDDDAVNTEEVVDLKIGDAPSKEQLKKANTDMVWITEEEVAGFKIYIPVVYLAEELNTSEEEAE